MNHKYDAYIGILPDSNFATIQSDKITCPLGQLVISSYAKERIPGLEAIIFNGLRTSKTVMLDYVKDEVNKGKKTAVGITLTAGNSEDGFEIAQKANSYGADVFIGGTETTMCGNEILKEREYIKVAIFGAGEQVMTYILQGNALESISNIVFAKGKKTVNSPIKIKKLDFKNINIDYNLLYNLKEHNGVSYLYGNDCKLAVKQRCYFCGRPSLGIGFRDPVKVWDEISNLYEKGMAAFFNTMDNAAVSMKKLKEFAKAKPHHLRFDQHRTFINATDVNEESIAYLEKINVLAAVGLENFALMEKVGKGKTKIVDNLNALQKLRDARIPVFLSMVMGIPGETKETLEENAEWIDYIFREYGEIIDQFLISPLMVTTASRAYQDLMALPDMKRKYKDKQMPFDIFEMSIDYFDNFCQISREETLKSIYSIIDNIKKYYPRTTVRGHLLYTEAQIKGVKR